MDRWQFGLRPLFRLSLIMDEHQAIISQTVSDSCFQFPPLPPINLKKGPDPNHHLSILSRDTAWSAELLRYFVSFSCKPASAVPYVQTLFTWPQICLQWSGYGSAITYFPSLWESQFTFLVKLPRPYQLSKLVKIQVPILVDQGRFVYKHKVQTLCANINDSTYIPWNLYVYYLVLAGWLIWNPQI